MGLSMFKSLGGGRVELDGVSRVCCLRWDGLRFKVCFTQTKPSTIGPSGNDLQEYHSLTRSDYGRLQNEVSIA